MSKQKPQEDPEFGLGKKFIELYRAWHKQDDDFRRWFDKYDSDATRRDYLYSASVLFEATKLAPHEIVSRYTKGGKIRRDMLDDVDLFITKLEREEKVHMARNIWTYIVSLLKARGAIMGAAAFELKKPEVKIRAPQYIPTEEQYQVMLRYALSARNRFLLSFFRSGGPRIGATNDPEPMRLRHLLDLDLKALETGEVKFKHSSSCAVLVYGAFKGEEIVRYNETYVTFLLPETMTYVTEYLQERMRLGEKLTADTYLFMGERSGRGDILSTEQISRLISEISIRAGFTIKNDDGTVETKYSAHSLRRLFDNTMQGINDVDHECLMGHIKGVRAHYHASVDEMPKAIAYMRQQYEFGMRTLITTVTAEEQRKRSVIDYARMQGLTDEQIKGIQETIGLQASADDLRNALAQVLSLRSKRKGEQTATNGGKAYEAVMITENDLLRHVEQGWEVVRELANGRIIVRRKPERNAELNCKAEIR